MWLIQKSFSDSIIAQVTELLVKNGLSVNQQNEDGDDALILLSRYLPFSDKTVAIAQVLIDHGVSVFHKNKQGKTAEDLLNERSIDGRVSYRTQILESIKKVGLNWKPED